MLDRLQYKLLKWVANRSSERMTGDVYAGEKLTKLLGDMLPDVRGKAVVDFGCGIGTESAMLVKLGADAFGLDIQDDVLIEARKRHPGVVFGTQYEGLAEYIISLDAFEHFADPADILDRMSQILDPGGAVLVSFGPTWYHPLGGHLFSVFPWAHLIFSEAALITWRSDVRSDGATRFSEVAGGLNQMTIKRFESIVASSPLQMDFMECVPIRSLRWAHSRLTREWTTAIVRCQLRHR